MNTTNLDIRLFESVTALMMEGQRSQNSERRASPRYPFRCVQLVAPYDGKDLPGQQSFRQVMCHDLSPNGFSYFSCERPETPRVIVALGQIPSIKFYIAEVARVTCNETMKGSEYRVGCRLVRRLDSNEQPSNSRWNDRESNRQ